VSIIDTLGPGSTLVGDYKIIRVLGSGGFGNTYLAMDHNLNREVAIKEFFPRDIAFREDQTTVSIKSPRFEDNFRWGLERFVQEAKLLAKFRHPNIVRVFRTFEANHTSYIVLDFVRGPNVETWLQRLNRRPTQQELDELVAPLTDALALLHEAGVLHRDIKPANICIREETGDAVLLDFGASKYSMSEMTGTTAAIVSRGYSPYEAYAADSKQQGAWTDIYALGATVYRALTGGSPPEATERRLNDTIVPLRSQRLPGLRPEFLAAVDWALTVQPRARPQSIAEWQPRLLAGSEVATTSSWQARRLQGGGAYVGGEASGARSKATVPMSERATARPSRRRTVALALVLLLLLGGGTLAMWQIQEQQREEIRRQDEARRNTEAEAQRLAEARRQAEEDARRRNETNRAEEERRQARKAAEEERQAAIRAAAAKAEQEEADRQAKKREQQEERQAAIKAAAAKAEQEEADRQAKKREQQEERQAAIKAAAAKAEQEEADRQAKKEERDAAAKAAAAARAAAAAEPDERRRKREPEKRVERKRSISQGSSSPRSSPSGQTPTITGIR
jgi:tRNA A-37 threonylcarbamoyl transferase component Bud32